MPTVAGAEEQIVQVERNSCAAVDWWAELVQRFETHRCTQRQGRIGVAFQRIDFAVLEVAEQWQELLALAARAQG